MKSMIDNFVSVIVFVVIIFGIASFSVVEMQIMTARHIHTAVVNQIQASYYKVDLGCENTHEACMASGGESSDTINRKLHEQFPDWYVTSEVLNSVNDRQDRLVTLHYKVILPMFGIVKTGEIDGYAR